MQASWIDRNEYPFQAHAFQVPVGKMHYVDEGQGRPIVMIHGTPTWSYLYRHLIKGLSGKYRVVAPDLIGFGLSDKPPGWSYLPRDHAGNLEQLITTLGLQEITLIVHDFGGPIGLSYAIRHPENVRDLVLFNTFLWSLRGDPAFERPARLFNNPLGKFAYLQLGFSANFMIPAAWGDRSKLTREIHRHYQQALPDAPARQGTWIFFRELLGSSDWYEELWEQRQNIQNKPALILWGMKDIAFQAKELDRWKALFPHARVIQFPEAGHFVQEEEGENLVPVILEFLERE